MPSTYPLLRQKFMKNGTDGILDAENILLSSGWKVDNGWITMPVDFQVEAYTFGEQIDARDYLLEEWDYGMQ